MRGFLSDADRKYGYRSILCLLLFRQVLPEADGHILTLFPQVDAFFDGHRLEVAAPQVLKQLLVFGHQRFVEPSAQQSVVVRKRDFACRLQVVIVAVPATQVVDYPRLVGKAVGEMIDGQG